MEVYWTRYAFEVEHASLLTQNINITRFQSTGLLETWFLFLILRKDKNRIKKDL